MKTTAGTMGGFALLWSCIIGAAFAQDQSPPGLSPNMIIDPVVDCKPEELCKPRVAPPNPSMCFSDLECRPGTEKPVLVTQYNYVGEVTSTSWVKSEVTLEVTDIITHVTVTTDHKPPQVICQPTSTTVVEVPQVFWYTSTDISYSLTTTTSHTTITTTVSPPALENCVTDKKSNTATILAAAPTPPVNAPPVQVPVVNQDPDDD